MKSSLRSIFLLAALAAGSFVPAFAANGDIDPIKLREMKDKILQSARQISAEYGNPAFSIIITSEPDRAEQVKNRLSEMQKVDASEALLKDMEGRTKMAQAELAAKESYLTSLEQKLKGTQLALTETEKRIAESNARTEQQPAAPQQPVPAPAAPHADAPHDAPPAPTPDANASTNEVLKNLGLDQNQK